MSQTGARYLEVVESGQRVDNYLLRELKSVPRTRIYRMLRRGEVRVNGGRVTPGYRVQSGDRLRLPPLRDASPRPGQPRAPSRQIQRLRQRILFEDDDLLALDKPAGLAVHGGSGVRLGVIETLRAERPGASLGLAHRIDRDTSGCLLVAKSRASLLELHRIFRAGEAIKSYQLLVAGRWPAARRSVNLALHRYVTGTGERRVRPSRQGRPARTDFSLVHQPGPGADAQAAVTWLRARLHTGRTHQIRVHASASGHPLLGDDKYGTEASASLSLSLGVSRLCLHAVSLALPWAGDTLRLEAPLPTCFEEAWQSARP